MFEPPRDPQLPLGPGEPELAEEDLRERVVVVLAGVHQHLLVRGAQRSGDGRGLDELRAVADDCEDLHVAQTICAAASNTPSERRSCEAGRGAHHRGRPVDHRRGPDHVAAHPELLGLEAEREADELGEVQDGHLQLAADDAFGGGLLEVEVQVAERAGGDQAVGVGVHGVAEVAPGLLEGGLLVHRDDREAAALAHAGVLDHGAAERLDHLLAGSGRGVVSASIPRRGGAARCSSRRRAPP